MNRHDRIDPTQGPTEELGGACVCDRMSRPAVIVLAGTPITEALRLMTANRIHYLPVVDEEARLVGIVNSDDVLGTCRLAGPRPELVAAVMSTPVVSIGPKTPLREAMHLMADRQIGALPVVDGGRVVGILSQSDIVKAAACHELP